MPTGYTADVVNGKITDLEPFVWQLARGMGALDMMRDDPHDAPVPERFEPSQYNAEKLVALRVERDRLRGMSLAAVVAAALAEVAEYEECKRAYLSKKVEERERYQAMIDKLEAWEGAPEGIKEFGLEQLRRGMEFDCPRDERYYRERPTSDGQEWRAGKLEKVEKDILYHAKEQAAEDARTEGRNSWLACLRASLAQGMSTGTAKTAEPVEGEACQPGGEAMRPNSPATQPGDK